VIGNYSEVNVGVKVPGILTPGIYNGTQVDLLPFFSGGFASTNDGVSSTGVVQNFLDDGGAGPLMSNMAANGTSSEPVVSSLTQHCPLNADYLVP
jgi:hypothetical protein